MHKIASTHELHAELQRLLDYSQNPRPSRTVLATELQMLSARLKTVSVFEEPPQAVKARKQHVEILRNLALVNDAAKAIRADRAAMRDPTSQRQLDSLLDAKVSLDRAIYQYERAEAKLANAQATHAESLEEGRKGLGVGWGHLVEREYGQAWRNQDDALSLAADAL